MLTKTLLILLALIGLAVPIAASLGWLGLTIQYVDSSMPLYRALGDMVWQTGTDFLLVAIPMFILMGEILLRAGITERMYDGMVRWLGWLPGGLMHSNIGASALFAATSGSSVATAATIGTVAVPQVAKRGYNEPLFLGTVAAGGTLGILIPPSINLILYGLLTDTSVPELYLAGFLPGFLLAVLFMGTIVFLCVVKPGWGGESIRTSWRQRLLVLPALIPPLGIFAVVVGSIYAGIATPTEAASLGVVAALVLAAFNRKLTFEMIRAATESTIKTTAMIMLIIIAAVFLNFVLSVVGLTQALADFVTGLGLSKGQTMIMIVVVLVVIGCFMETLSMLLTTAPLITPIVIALGYDPVWFGILLMVVLETALITPPIGINLYVVQGIRKGGRMSDVIKGATPFVVTMFAMIVLLLMFPSIALWLPSLVY
ncbi:MAG: TRAP transporter large permease [Pseudomonadota bacterium]